MTLFRLILWSQISYLISHASSNAHAKCNENGSFRIVQFTDAHFGESPVGDIMTTGLMNSVLDAERPDLVVLSGDILSGYTWNGNPGWFDSVWLQVVTPMIERDIPWIFTAGNHDAEGELNRTQIFELDATKYSAFGSLTQTGFIDAESGQNIYFVDVVNSVSGDGNKHETATAARIWMIDSGMLDCGMDTFESVTQCANCQCD